MFLYTLKGKRIKKKINQYAINWSRDSKSKLQFRAKQLLKPHWFSHLVYEEFPVYGTRQRVDFINFSINVAIEVNGDQHDKFVPHFHKNEQGFIKSLRLDREKREWLELNGIELIEIMESDLKQFSPEYIESKFNIRII